MISNVVFPSYVLSILTSSPFHLSYLSAFLIESHPQIHDFPTLNVSERSAHTRLLTLHVNAPWSLHNPWKDLPYAATPKPLGAVEMHPGHVDIRGLK
jgi:hypothetical protein